MLTTFDVLGDVWEERQRQQELLEIKKIPWDTSDPVIPTAMKLSVLVEEVGEVARAILEESNLREELIQVAAVAVAWAESL